MFGMFGIMDTLFPFLFITTFVIVIGGFIFIAVRGISEWSKNNAAPRLTVQAKIIDKREHHTSHRSQNGMRHYHTYYYISFEVESGDRMELAVTGSEYGLLAAGDEGALTFQGTRFLSFDRNI